VTDLAPAPVAIADTSGLLAYFDRSEPEHSRCRAVMATLSHAVISPMVLAELDYLLTTGIGATAAEQALDYIVEQIAIRRFEVPDAEPELAVAHAVMRRHGEIGLTDAMNVALAATFRTNVMFTLDRKHFRAVRPLSGDTYFRLLPDDL
jgi:uncharacterized protein